MARPTYLGGAVVGGNAATNPLTGSVTVPSGATHATVFVFWQLGSGTPGTFSCSIGGQSGTAIGAEQTYADRSARAFGVVLSGSGSQTLSAGDGANNQMAALVHFWSNVDSGTPWITTLYAAVDESSTAERSVSVGTTTADEMVSGACYFNTFTASARTVTSGAGQTETNELNVTAPDGGAGYEYVVAASYEDGTGSAVTHSYTISDVTPTGPISHVLAVRVVGGSGGGGAVTSPYYFMRSRRTAA